MADSDVEMGSAADIGNRRLRMDQELATATRGRVQLVLNNHSTQYRHSNTMTAGSNPATTLNYLPTVHQPDRFKTNDGRSSWYEYL
jgi:hypothetical protein